MTIDNWSGKTDPADVLMAHHRALDERLDRLVKQAQDGDLTHLRAEWNLFAAELVRHLEAEEMELVPAYEQAHPNGARAMLAEHDQIRRDLAELGATLANQRLSPGVIESFVRRLKGHARWEERVLYPWAGQNIGDGAWRSIKRALRAAMEGWRYGARLHEPNLWDDARRSG